MHLDSLFHGVLLNGAENVILPEDCHTPLVLGLALVNQLHKVSEVNVRRWGWLWRPSLIRLL